METPQEPRHPETGDPLSDLERILWRFRMAAHEAKTMWRGFNATEDVARDINSALMLGLTNQCLLIVQKFLEVWDDFGGLAPEDPRVISARRAVQPIVTRIEVWPGLRQFRNSVLAHAYLDKDGRLVRPTEMIRSGAAPTFHAEIILLMQLVVIAVLAILLVFESEYTGIDELTRDPTPWRMHPGPGIQRGHEIRPELQRVALIVQENLASMGVTPQGPLIW